MDDDLPGLFTLCRNVSKLSTYKIKLGAVLCRHNKPISVGFNKTKYSKAWSYEGKTTIHAEAEALRLSGKDTIKNGIMYVYREYKNGKPALSKPCKNCQKLMKEKGIKRVIYSTNEYPYFEVMEL